MKNVIEITPDNAEEILKELRLREDMTFIEPIFGDHVWLKRSKGGITDCCLVEDPCDHHSKLTHQAHPTDH